VLVNIFASLRRYKRISIENRFLQFDPNIQAQVIVPTSHFPVRKLDGWTFTRYKFGSRLLRFVRVHAFDGQSTDRQILTETPRICIRSRTVKSNGGERGLKIDTDDDIFTHM